MNHRSIAERLQSHGLVPVIRAAEADTALQLCEALYVGGIRCLEVTLTTPNALELVTTSRKRFSDALVGVGSVHCIEQVQASLNAGAQFVVSPGYVPELVNLSQRQGAATLPGAMTASEAMRVYDEGADFVKIFPASALGGPAYIKALLGPLPHLKLMPSSGINLETVSSHFAAGASIVGVGAALADVELLKQQGPEAVSALATRYLSAVTAARS